MSTNDQPDQPTPIASPSAQLDALEQESAARTAALLAPIEARFHEHKAQERAAVCKGALLEGAAAVFALTFDECGRTDSEFVSFQHAWDLGTIDATNLLRRMAGRPVELGGKPKNDGIMRVPISRSVRYAVKGAPEVPDEYNETRTIAPTEITFTYRAVPDAQLGRVHAYVKGWWMQDGARVHAEAVGRHFWGSTFDDWPDWLAAEAREHDPGQPS